MQKAILSIFTRTPLHVGAGSSVGAVDLPVIRERHTRFPVIPGSSLKGVLSDLWNDTGEHERTETALWLFGAEDSTNASAGALLIGEGKLLLFPLRSAKGSFAWVTCPLALTRFKRDNAASFTIPTVTEDQCFAADGVVLTNDSDEKVILEEYVFARKEPVGNDIVTALDEITKDTVLDQLSDKLVIISDEAFSYFAENACETAHHIKIDDKTGSVQGGAFFDQENVPSETLFYSVIHAQREKTNKSERRSEEDAMSELNSKISENVLIQIGANETTGLGLCSVALKEVC